MKNTKIIVGSLIGLMLAGCEYSNTFVGSYNGATATLDAYSKNINRKCISLNLKQAGASVKTGYVSAQLLFDPSDFLKAKSFNSKGNGCNSKMSEYLAGTRSVQVLSTSETRERESAGVNMCQDVYYNVYTYKELIDFDYKDVSNDQVTGHFNGEGAPDSYIDYSRPTRYGPIYFCGPVYPGPYPGPYPRPYPYPRYPRMGGGVIIIGGGHHHR